MVDQAWVSATPDDGLTTIAGHILDVAHDVPGLAEGDRVLVMVFRGNDTGMAGHGYSGHEGFLDLMTADAATAAQGLVLAGGRLPDG